MLAAHVLRSYHLEPISEQPPGQSGFIATVIPNGIPMRGNSTQAICACLQ